MSSSRKIDNEKKDILILGEDPTQELEHKLSAEKMYSMNVTENNKKVCLSLHYIGGNSYLFANGTEIYKFKTKDYKIVATPLSLRNISKGNMKKSGLNWYVYDFSVDYDAIEVDDVLHIYKYLMKQMRLYKIFTFVKYVIIAALTSFNCNVNLLGCVSMSNQEYKVRPEIVEINSNELAFSPYSVRKSKFSVSWNNINNPFAKLCASDVVKNKH